MQYQAVDYQQGVSNAWSNIATFVPKFLVFLIILIIGYFIAKAVEKILDKVLQRVGFDELVERGGVKKALAKSKYDAASILGKLVYYAIMLFVLSAAFGVFGNNPISAYLRSIVAYLPKVFVAILIVIVTMAHKAKQRPDAQTRMLHLAGQLFREALVGFKELERTRHELRNRFRIELADIRGFSRIEPAAAHYGLSSPFLERCIV